MGIKNLTLCTYTHTNCNDLHQVYLDRIKKYFKNINNVVFCNNNTIHENTIIYNNNSLFYEQMIFCLSAIETEYIIYSQEDYILYDYVKINVIKEFINTMEKDESISFIRLIKSGINIEDELNEYNNDLFIINPVNNNYYYSSQATIWRKNVLEKMFKLSKPQSIRDEQQNSTNLVIAELFNHQKMKGLCSYMNGKKVGLNHYNSCIYPYIATAIVNGKWNYSEYKIELDKIFYEYKIDKNIRGFI